MRNKNLASVLLAVLMASATLVAEEFNPAIDVEARAANWNPSLRYPDPAIEVLDPSFMKYRLFNASVEQLTTGFRWGEGPAWNKEEGYLVFSDLPSNRIIRWDEETGKASIHKPDSSNANGNIYDLQGRLVTAEHLGRRVIRTNHDGSVTVLADSYQGKQLNSPNDLAVETDGSIWFTDPPFGLGSYYEGDVAEPELDFHGVYRIDGETGELQLILDDLVGPNGLAFSPDGNYLYVVEARATPNRLLWRYDVAENGNLSNKTLHFEAFNSGAIDGFKVDVDGNIWAGWGSNGALGVDPAPMDGVIVINPEGDIIGHIHTPERCANVEFGGEHRNRLYMTCSHSLYSLYVNTQGAY
jgi:gluconolactonase